MKFKHRSLINGLAIATFLSRNSTPSFKLREAQ
jgi:hypothetical protein